ncbi:permease-like cell division protein FtsX [Enterococcus cecorum]|nr:permease-like cell division protein FtsX [Enterococcus cecorum]KLO70652.1 cell division protein FtsX [Enterococcus cecorum]MCJ0565037.1 permease-like cell division protein FtsX [Enterococcus cecorum]MCJ0567083.1 permease-like cell division protein FtsX [Enterococcus cecorum]MCJ0573836.1 permease-like cell division protein FtsX [Enterococcus cecorum]MCJ0576143.1 permease-like cell division protein FtsX [Enterococcus cecorum]
MATMIRTFFRHLLESLKSLKRNGWMTVASATAVAISLTLLGIFLALIMNATKLAEDIENNVDISVLVDIGTNQEDIDKLKKELEDLPNVKSVEFSSKDEELKKLEESMGSVWSMFEGDSNPLYDNFIVKAKNPQTIKKVAKQAAKLKNVHRADYGGLVSDKILKITKGMRTWGLGAAVLLVFVAVFLISNTIRITIMSRQREIQIMRLVGAKNGYIRWPFFLEGAWIGVIGSILPCLIIFFGYKAAYRVLSQPQILGASYRLLTPETFSIQIMLLLVGIGILIGALGSVISMRRFLKI